VNKVDDAPAPTEIEESDEPRLVPLRQLMSANLSSGSERQDEDSGDQAKNGESRELTTSPVRFVPTPSQALHELAIFRGLDPALRDMLIQKGTTQTLPEGTQIVREGETPNAVVSFLRGTGKLFFTAGSGRVGHARIVFAPTSIGHHEIATQQPLQASLKLIEKSTLWVLPAMELRRALASSPKLQENVIAETASELREMSELARALLFDDTASRLAQMMLKFAEKRGLPGQEGTIIPLALTQQDFAEALGVDLRSINRVMVEWFGARLIVKSEKRFVLVDSAKLSEIALQFRPK
jgi:CRP-like cAMP-binding protein